MSTTNATKRYLDARVAVEVAEQALAQAEQALKEAYARTGIDSSILDGKKVSIVRSEREKYSADLLKGLVDSEVFDKVSKIEIDSKKFRAAVELGVITDEVAKAVTKVTLVEAVRVNEVAPVTLISDTKQFVA